MPDHDNTWKIGVALQGVLARGVLFADDQVCSIFVAGICVCRERALEVAFCHLLAIAMYENGAKHVVRRMYGLNIVAGACADDTTAKQGPTQASGQSYDKRTEMFGGLAVTFHWQYGDWLGLELEATHKHAYHAFVSVNVLLACLCFVFLRLAIVPCPYSAL